MEQILPYLIIAGKSISVYLFMILAIRLFGKKELAQLSVVDLVFILLISNSVQNAMVGSDSTLLGGLSAAFALFLSNYIFKFFLRSSPGFSHMVQGKKIILVHDGQVNDRGMEEAMMSMDELKQAVREHGVEHIGDVNLAILEVDGNISILSEDYRKRSTKVRKKMQLSHNP
jgi:uncharacterized membrane protein YcaP (DUF421 family)